MPARSCQCPERRAPIASRRWEVCSKPGDGTTVVRCKECGAIWTTRGKFADTMPYDIGPVTFMPEALQHSRCEIALTAIAALIIQYAEASKTTTALHRLWQDTVRALEDCRPSLRKRRGSRGADRFILKKNHIVDHYLDNTRDAQLGWAEMFIGADTYLCSTIGLCPKFTNGPEWHSLRKLMDRWSEGWLAVRPDAKEGGQRFYEELVA